MSAVRVSSLLRALGPAVASTLPDAPTRVAARAVVLSVCDFAARRVDPRGISLLSVTPDKGKTFSSAQRVGSEALTATTWVSAWLLLTIATDRLPVPRALTALGLGGAVYVLDTMSAQLADQALRAANSAEEAAFNRD